MRGIILGYDPHLHTGAISGPDGERYAFGRPDWQADTPPAAGQEVEFTADGDTAAGISPYLELSERFSWKWFLLSLNGRIGRKSFWLRWILPWLAAMIVCMTAIVVPVTMTLISSHIDPNSPAFTMAITKAMWPFFVVIFILLWPSIATQVKRLHDRGRSGWILGAYWILLIISDVIRFKPIHAAIIANTGTAVIWAVFQVAMFIFALWLLAETLFLRGTQGPNRYGAVTR